MRLQQVAPEAIGRAVPDRTLAELDAHTIGVRIGAVYMGIASQGVDPETARSLAQDFVFSRGWEDAEEDE